MARAFAFIILLSIIALNDYASADACSKDVDKFCKDVRPGGGRIQTCLKQHEKELSGDCKNKNEKQSQSREEISDQCKEDVKKFCDDTRGGKGRKLVCLNENVAKLSQGCRSAIKDAKGRK